MPSSHSNSEAETSHAASVLLDRGLAVLGGVCSGGEQHALVALRFLVFAYAAGLCMQSQISMQFYRVLREEWVLAQNQATRLTFGLDAASVVLGATWALSLKGAAQASVPQFSILPAVEKGSLRMETACDAIVKWICRCTSSFADRKVGFEKVWGASDR